MKKSISLLKIIVGSKPDLQDIFFIKLKDLANKYGMKAEDLLLVMYSESGLKASAMNPDGHAVGIGQFMPEILKNLGWTKGPEEFAKLPAHEQLDYMDKLMSYNIKANGGKPFKTAAQYYQAHFLPATLSRGTSSDTIIADGRPGMQKASWEKAAYDHNTAFDKDKKGYITVGDLEKVVAKKRSEAGFQELLNKLNSVSSSSIEATPPVASKETESPELENSLDAVNNFLDQTLQNVANKFLVYIKGDSFNTELEFGRILTSAINTELKATATIYSDNSKIEIFSNIKGPKNISIDAFEELINHIKAQFKKATSKDIEYFINYGESPSLNPIDFEKAYRNYRLFKLNFLKDRK